MKKSLLAVAVAAALPAFAYAQTNVTLSGMVKTGYNYVDVSDATDGTKGDSASAIADGSSRFVISGTENLGGGLMATFQWDTRLRPDEATSGQSSLGSGASWVGLKGQSWGELRIGRLDQYYFRGSDRHAYEATALQAWNVGILSYVGGQVGTGQTSAAIANASRTNNLIRWDSPNWGGFGGGVGYSTAFQGAEAVGTVGQRRGAVGRCLLRERPAQRRLQLLGCRFREQVHRWPAGMASVRHLGLRHVQHRLHLGPVRNQGPAIAGGAGEWKRDAWSIPVTVKLGPGKIIGAYTMADDRSVNGSDVADSGAKMWSIGYDYPLSKRTSVGLSYVDLSNDRNAAYSLFTGGALSTSAAVRNGADTSQLYLGLLHRF